MNTGKEEMQSEVHRLDARFGKSQVVAAARRLHHDECGIAGLFGLMVRAESPRVAYNAAWILSHLSGEDKKLYLHSRYGELVRLVTSATLCFRRGLVLSILVDLPTGDEPDGLLLDYCLAHIADAKESSSARACMIRLAARMCRPYPELCSELALCLDMLPPGMPPSIACAKKNVLKMLLGSFGG